MAKEHPTLFSTPMVKAIIEGRKIMTRRIATKDPTVKNIYWQKESETVPSGKHTGWVKECSAPLLIPIKCPYGKVGDLLYVKETFQFVDSYPEPDCLGLYLYKANGDTSSKWRPSLFMPKEAARIWLEITDIKVERLKDISEEDAINEGIEDLTNGQQLSFRDYLHSTHPLTAKASFKSLWQSINGEESWELNPYVWVLCFKPKNTILKTN